MINLETLIFFAEVFSQMIKMRFVGGTGYQISPEFLYLFGRVLNLVVIYIAYVIQ